MQLGIQTISWGARLGDLRQLCQSLRSWEFQGIEIAQNVRQLPAAAELKSVLESTGMVLAGLAGGSIRARVDYCDTILTPSYLYLDEWDPEGAAYAFGRGFSVAFHPHVYKAIDKIAKAQSLLESFQFLRIIVDTAHAYLVDEDVPTLLPTVKDRLAAIHLKDWSPRFGRSPHGFARGFASLGDGILGDTIERTLQVIQDLDYAGWVIVEQDHADNPAASALKSRKWLKERGQ